jgi:membrane-associated protease RseP (regulator of RpoE activity)
MNIPVKPILAALLLAIPMPSPARAPRPPSAPRIVVVEDRDDDGDVVEVEAPDPPETPETPEAPLPPRAPLAPRVRVRGLDAGSYLGVRLLDITPELRAHFGAPKEAGVLVAEVEKDSPAAKAGVEVGDVLTAVDGERLSDAWNVSRTVRHKAAGDSVKLDVVRKGAAKTLTVKVERRTLGDDEAQWRDFGRSFGRDFGRDIARDVQRSLRSRPWAIDVDSDRVAVLSGSEVRKLRERVNDLERRLKDLEERKTR